MCVGVSNAAPKTHSTIVATLVVPVSGTGPLLVPTALRTATNTGATSATPTPTVSLPAGTKSESTTASRTTPAAASRTSRATATTGPIPDGPPQFTNAQIAGLVLGGISVLIFGVLLVLLARCVRRKRYGDLEKGFSKLRDSMSFGRKSQPNSPPEGGLQISSPLHQVQAVRNPTDPRWQPNMQQKGVGLAISPMTAARGGVLTRPSPALTSLLSAPLPRTPPKDPFQISAPRLAPAPPSVPTLILTPPRPSPPAARGSPPKPTLALAIPKGQARAPPVRTSSRDSVVTEFAEDGEGDAAPVPAVWRPPPTDPLSATTLYFSDGRGNWILRNSSVRQPEPPVPARRTVKETTAAPVQIELPSPHHQTRAERAKDAYGGFSPDAVVSPLRLPLKPGNPRLGSPIAFKDQRREPQISSPSLSARLSQTAESIQGDTRNHAPDVYFGLMREARDLTGGKSRRRSARRASTSRRVSQGSVTSIESGAEDDDAEPQDLSPVVESPQTPISPGKSPVTYPKIRKRNDGQGAAPTRAAEPDLLPSAHKYNVWHPPGRSSPTGAGSLSTTGTANPPLPSSNGPRRPWNAPALNPNRNPGQLRTGSPETRFTPAPPDDNQYRPSQRPPAPNPSSYWTQPQTQPARNTRPPPPPSPPYELPGEANTKRYQTPPPQQQQQQQPRRPPRPTNNNNNAPFFLPTPAATPQQQQPTPKRTPAPSTPQPSAGTPNQPQNQASLLAKRRGAEKAASLTLANNNKKKQNGSGSGGEGKQRRAGGGGGAGWTREDQYGNGNNGGDDGGIGPVPITPGWVPELTPTRRGGDLVLNVR